MKYIWICLIAFSLGLASCGKKGPKSDLDSKDTLTVDEMEEELKKLEEESASIDEQMDSLNKEIDKDE